MSRGPSGAARLSGTADVMTRDWSHLDDRRPVGQLSPDPWFTAAPLRRLIAILEGDGLSVRLIGGCVRDGLLRRPVHDVDLATPALPERIQACLEGGGVATVPWARGLAHGTVLAVVDGQPFEITTLRRDVACDGRHAEVVFTDDWMADAARRDFTINALSATPDGAVYDYFDGIADLSAGRVRFVGRAVERLREDALRALRFFRFHAHYAQGAPDADGFAACQALAHMVDGLSAERVRTELLKTLMAPAPAEALLTMRAAHVLARVLPEAVRFDSLRMLAFLETRGIIAPDVAPDGLRRLAAVVDVDAGAAEAMAARLRLSRAETRRLVALVATPPETRPRPDPSPGAPWRLMDQLGRDLARDLCLLDWARERAGNGRTDSRRSEAWRVLLDGICGFDPPAFPLTGKDLLAAGVPAGPAVGRALAGLRAWWLDQACQPGRDALLARLRDPGVW